MTKEQAATYLNDHLAGSSGALELLEHLERLHEGEDLAVFAAGLRGEIGEERKELEGLIERLGMGKSVARKAAGWLAEKAAGVKLGLDDLGDEGLRTLEILEALSLGIEGKRLLSRSMAAAAGSGGTLEGFDFEWLGRRSEDQRRRVEEKRLEAARKVMGDL